MQCGKIRRRLSSYQDRQLAPAEMDLIRDHLHNCPDCALEFEKLNLVWNALDNVDKIESAPYFWQKLSQKLNQASNGSKQKKKIEFELRPLPVPIIAILLLLFSLWTGFHLGKTISLYSNNASGNSTEIEKENILAINSVEVITGETAADVYKNLITDENQ